MRATSASLSPAPPLRVITANTNTDARFGSGAEAQYRRTGLLSMSLLSFVGVPSLVPTASCHTGKFSHPYPESYLVLVTHDIHLTTPPSPSLPVLGAREARPNDQIHRG